MKDILYKIGNVVDYGFQTFIMVFWYAGTDLVGVLQNQLGRAQKLVAEQEKL